MADELTEDDVRRTFPQHDPRKLEVVVIGGRVYQRDQDGVWRHLPSPEADGAAG